MNTPLRSIPRVLLLVAPLAVCVTLGPTRWARGQAELDQQQIYRFDPVAEQFVVAPAEQQRVGYVYRRFNPHSARWIWCLYKGGGQFSFALGEGTIQPAQRLDQNLTVGEAKKAIRRINPALADAIKDRAGRVFVRLNRQDRWELYGPFGLPSVFDRATGRRWEDHAGQYVPVSHTTGYHWRVQNGRYVPATVSYSSYGCDCGSSRGY